MEKPKKSTVNMNATLTVSPFQLKEIETRLSAGNMKLCDYIYGLIQQDFTNFKNAEASVNVIKHYTKLFKDNRRHIY